MRRNLERVKMDIDEYWKSQILKDDDALTTRSVVR